MPAGLPLVLVVEDDEATSELIQIILSRAGYRVRTAPDGVVAVSRMQLEQPDLVVLDMMMPRAGGLDVLQTLRASEWGLRIPVLMTTAGTRPDRIVEAIRAGASDYMMKPFSAEALLAAVERLLRGDVLPSEDPAAVIALAS